MRRPLSRRAGPCASRRLAGAEPLEGRMLLSTATPVGAEFPVNGTTTANQLNAACAVTPDGGSIVAWQSGETTAADVYARRFSASGVPLGSEFRVNEFVNDSQAKPAVAADGHGNFIVAWQSFGQDGNGWGIFARRFDPAGAPIGAEFPVNTGTLDNQIGASVAADADGNFVIAWTGPNDGDGEGTGVLARRFDSSGQPLGPESLVNLIGTGVQSSAAVAADSAGGFVVIWQSFVGGDWFVSGRRYAAGGAPADEQFDVTTSPTPSDVPPEPAVAPGADGGFIVAWQTPIGGGTSFGTSARRFGPDGKPLGDPFAVGGHGSAPTVFPAAAPDPAGGFVVTWAADGGADAFGTGVYARRYDAAGAPEGAEFLVNGETAGQQVSPAVAGRTGGPLVFAWQTPDADGSGVAARGFAVGADANEAPTTTGIAPVSAAEDGPDPVVNLFNAFADSTDPDPALVYEVTGNSNAGLFTFLNTDPSAGTLTLRFAPDAFGSSDLTIRATDTGGLFVETTFTVTVSAVNDAPVNSVPGPQDAVAGRPLVFSAANGNAVSVSDVDAGSDPLQVTLSASGGTLTLGAADGLTFSQGDGVGDAAMMFTGTAGAINAALERLRFDTAATFAGPGSVSITTDDLGHNGSGGALSDADSIPVNVTQPPPPSISITGATVTEADAPTTVDAVFTVTLSEARPYPVTVQYATQNGATGIAGVATAPRDYAAAVGTLTFNPGETSKTIPIAVAGDALNEVDEGFTVVLSNPTSATLGTTSAVGRILDNDPMPSLTAGDATVVEGGPGTSTTITFTITLSAPSAQLIRSSYTVGVVGDTALRFIDYNASPGIVNFQPGETVKTVTATVIGDALDEADEHFAFLFGFLTTNFQIEDGQAVGTIIDDDPPPALSINDVSVAEGDAAEGPLATLTVSLSAVSGQRVTVNYFTSNDTAVAPGDYQPTSGVLTFEPGDTVKTIQVRVVGDTTREAEEESLNVFLSEPLNATFADSRGRVLIEDDDLPPTISVDDVSVAEGNAGTTPAVFTVRLSAASGLPVTVQYATADGTAVAGTSGDYDAASGTLTFAPGETSKTVTVLVHGDTGVEADETFALNLSAPEEAAIADGSAIGTIANDDVAGDAPPHVAEVFVGSTAWSAAFTQQLASLGLGSASFGYSIPGDKAQLDTLPWDGINRVTIRFDADVIVHQDDLAVRGINTADYTITGFSYDPLARAATWTLAQPLRADKVLLDLDGDVSGGVASVSAGGAGGAGPALDGEWLNGGDAFPSGNGTAGGDFEFRINPLPGDADRSGRADLLDSRQVTARLGTSTTRPGTSPNTYSVFCDLNGDGRINALDLAVVRRDLFRAPPAGEPSGIDPPPSPAAPRALLFGDAPLLA